MGHAQTDGIRLRLCSLAHLSGLGHEHSEPPIVKGRQGGRLVA